MKSKIPEHDKSVIVWTDRNQNPQIAKCWHIQDKGGVWYMWVIYDSQWEDYLNDPFSYSINTLDETVLNWSYVPEKQFKL
jgi:hypothetical protein